LNLRVSRDWLVYTFWAEVPLPSALSGSILEFGGYQLDCGRFELRHGDRIVRIERKPMELLILLASREGQLVARAEIAEQLWSSDVFVDTEHGINTAIRKLRHLLHDNPENPRFIQTVTGMGYRFIAPITTVDEVAPELATTPVTAAAVEPAEAVPPVLDHLISPEGENGTKRSRHRLWFALTVSGVLIAVILALVMVPAVRARYRIGLSWLGFRPSIQSVAVLPLVNLSSDPEQEYFSDGMTDQLITDLSFVKSLRVLSRESTIHFKNSQLSVPQIAEQLHVDAVIQGTVLRAGDVVRTTIHLTAASPERQLWAASYERSLSDVITLQNQIAADAVSQIRAQLTTAEQTRLKLESRINPAANDEYLRGRFFIGQEQPGKAIPHLEHAIQLDPDFAAAYGVLGEAWSRDGVAGGVFGSGNKDTAAKALEYSRKAVSLDPSSSEAYTALGHSLMQAHHWKEGEVALRRALELDPNNPYAAAYLAILVTETGRGDEGMRISRELAENNPVAVYCVRIYANVLHQTHHIDESLAVVQRALELDPNHPPTYGVLGRDLVEKGRFREAEDAYRKAGQLTPPFQAWIYAREGNVTEARKILNANPSMVNAHSAVARYLLGDQEAGLAELNRAADEWQTKTYLLRSDPLFDPMRNDPRFTAIVKRTGLLDN
jgi:TolB-like protein/DNA-binding winged helix-turn-helix (wHTH) protein/Flp pilus assembly protein TadD